MKIKSIIAKIFQYFKLSKEIAYYKDIEKFIQKCGYYERVLEVEGTDTKFCIMALKARKKAFQNGDSPKIIAALIMDAVRYYEENREAGMVFIDALASEK